YACLLIRAEESVTRSRLSQSLNGSAVLRGTHSGSTDLPSLYCRRTSVGRLISLVGSSSSSKLYFGCTFVPIGRVTPWMRSQPMSPGSAFCGAHDGSDGGIVKLGIATSSVDAMP